MNLILANLDNAPAIDAQAIETVEQLNILFLLQV